MVWVSHYHGLEPLWLKRPGQRGAICRRRLLACALQFGASWTQPGGPAKKIRDDPASVIADSLKEDAVDRCPFHGIPSSYEWPLDPHVASIHHPSKGPQRRQQQMQFFTTIWKTKVRPVCHVIASAWKMMTVNHKVWLFDWSRSDRPHTSRTRAPSCWWALVVFPCPCSLCRPVSCNPVTRRSSFVFCDSQMTNKSVAIRV